MAPRNWFRKRGGKDNFSFLFGDGSPVKLPGAIRYLEIGVHGCGSMLWMAKNVLRREGSIGIGVDPYCPMKRQPAEVTNARFRDARGTLAAYQNIRLVRDYSSRWLRAQRKPSQFDVIYIDGEHHAAFVLEDTVLAWPLLKAGGLIIWDDYSLVKRRSKGVKTAADSFLLCLENRCFKKIEVPSDYQLVVQKISDSNSSEQLPNGNPRLGTVI